MLTYPEFQQACIKAGLDTTKYPRYEDAGHDTLMVLDQYLRDYGMSVRDGVDAWEGFCQHEVSLYETSQALSQSNRDFFFDFARDMNKVLGVNA